MPRRASHRTGWMRARWQLRSGESIRTGIVLSEASTDLGPRTTEVNPLRQVRQPELLAGLGGGHPLQVAEDEDA